MAPNARRRTAARAVPTRRPENRQGLHRRRPQRLQRQGTARVRAAAARPRPLRRDRVLEGRSPRPPPRLLTHPRQFKERVAPGSSRSSIRSTRRHRFWPVSRHSSHRLASRSPTTSDFASSSSQEELAAKGKPSGHRRAFGYELDGVTIVKSEAKGDPRGSGPRHQGRVHAVDLPGLEPPRSETDHSASVAPCRRSNG